METDTSEQIKPTWPTKTYPLPWKYVPSNGDLTDRDWIEAANGNVVVDCVGNIDGPAICEACNNHHRLLEVNADLVEELQSIRDESMGREVDD